MGNFQNGNILAGFAMEYSDICSERTIEEYAIKLICDHSVIISFKNKMLSSKTVGKYIP